MENKNIEVELRSFITKEQYDILLSFFKLECPDYFSDDQVTYYFDAPIDIRIQKNSICSKIWMKKGDMHSEQREEIEVKFERDYFGDLEQIFVSLGFPVKVKWFRKRHTFSWKGCDVCVDANKGYGYILEIEKLTDEEGKDSALEKIRKLFDELDIPLTPKSVFDEKYKQYLKNWQDLIK